MPLSEEDLVHLASCVDLAEQALDAGDEPFGSLLVLDGQVRVADHNHVSGGDGTQHPEFAISRWAAQHLTLDERRRATVYTSGEHCPMCSAAHGWVGLGRIVYAASAEQFATWQARWGRPAAPVSPLPIQAVVPDAVVDGPAPTLTERIRAMHERAAR